jgi:small subunit ribosomal protein S4
MLQIKSKYKIAKRLGAGIFEQTQTQKFALVEANAKPKKRTGRGGGSDYGRQLLEKQKVRFTYGLSEKQLSNYAEKAFTEKNPSEALHKALELRADSAVYRAGLAPTRRAARQAVSHGHITVNGRRITMPSYSLKAGDKLGVREGNRKSPLYASLSEKSEQGRAVPQWLNVDIGVLTAEVIAEPSYAPAESGLDYPTVFEFYSR